MAVVRVILGALLCAGLIAGEPADIGGARTRTVWAGPDVNTLGGPSPDGRYLSYVDTASGDLAVRDLTTNVARRLTGSESRRTPGEFAYFSAISPDSRRVAYAWFNEKQFYELRVIGIDGTGERTLYRNEEAGFVQPCAWSPDGSEILTLLFRNDNISQIALISSEDGSARILRSLNWVYPKRMDVSPDGKYLVYDGPARDGAPERDIFVLSVDGSRETRLVDHPANDIFPLWSRDGRYITFASDRGGSMDLWMTPVADGRAAGDPVLVKPALGRFLPLGMTTRGELFFGSREGFQDVLLAEWDAETGGLKGNPVLASQRSVGGNAAPRWSPDGERLAWLSRRGSENYGQEARVITVRTIASGEESDLVTRLPLMERLRWSPDGKSLLVSGTDARRRSGLFRSDAASGATRPVVLEEEASIRGLEGEWMPDGKSVIYAVGNALRIKDLDSGEERRIVALPEHREIRNLALSRDGARVAFSAEPTGVLTVELESKAVREVQRFGGAEINGLAWTPAGDALIAGVVTGEKSALWRLPLDGGEARALPLGAPKYGVSLHPDGRRIAFTAGNIQSEIRVIENFLPGMQALR